MENKEITLDASELEAPYPLIKGIEAIKNLKDGEVLIFIHRMFPHKLEEYMKKNDCKYEIIKNEENYFKMKVYRS